MGQEARLGLQIKVLTPAVVAWAVMASSCGCVTSLSHLYMKFCTARFSRSLRCRLLLFLMSAVMCRNTSWRSALSCGRRQARSVHG